MTPIATATAWLVGLALSVGVWAGVWAAVGRWVG